MRTVEFQHCLIDAHHAAHEIETETFEELNIAGAADIFEHHHRHPAGGGVIHRAGPETAHADAAVIHGVRDHIAVVNANEAFGVAAHLLFPAFEHLPERLEVVEKSGATGGPVAHLDIDVEVEIGTPGRKFFIFDPRSLQPCGETVGGSHALELEETGIVTGVNLRHAGMELGNLHPEVIPETAVFLLKRAPVSGSGGNNVAGETEEGCARAFRITDPECGIFRHGLAETVRETLRLRETALLQDGCEIIARNQAEIRDSADCEHAFFRL